MKLFGMLVIFLLALSLAASAHISDYPSLFIKNGRFSGQIVVGSDAPATDVLAATDIALSLQQKSSSSVTANDESEFSHSGGILIGRPCENSAVAELLGTGDCGIGLGTGEGWLSLVDNSGFEYLIIAGNSPEDTRKAARFVATTGLSRYPTHELRISGTLDSPVVKNSEPLVIRKATAPVAECSSNGDCDDNRQCVDESCIAIECAEGTVAKEHRCIALEEPEENETLPAVQPLEAPSQPEEVPPVPEKQLGFFARILSFFSGLFS